MDGGWIGLLAHSVKHGFSRAVRFLAIIADERRWRSDLIATATARSNGSFPPWHRMAEPAMVIARLEDTRLSADLRDLTAALIRADS
jgi:hypothetical protein